MENRDPNHNGCRSVVVQHVTKPSSDQLLSKFAELGSDRSRIISAKNELRLAKKRIKRISSSSTSVVNYYKSENNTSSTETTSSNLQADRNSLLVVVPASRKSVALIQRRMSKAKIRAKDLKNKSIVLAIQKTWRRTIEGASRVLMEKHYNSHKRLINDIY